MFLIYSILIFLENDNIWLWDKFIICVYNSKKPTKLHYSILIILWIILPYKLCIINFTKFQIKSPNYMKKIGIKKY